MTPRSTIVAALAVGLGLSACDQSALDGSPRSARGLHPVVDSFIVQGHATPAAVKTRAFRAPSPEISPDQGIGLAWTAEPTHLQVFRSTAVHFRISSPPAEHPEATCSWNFGDGSPLADTCNTSHTFHGGRADQVVTLTLSDGDWRWTSTRTIPLERLEVVDEVVDEGASPKGLPPRPKPGETTFRFAIIADTAAQGGVPTSVQVGLEALREHVEPELLIHGGGIATSGATAEDIDQVRTHLLDHAQRSEAKVAWTLSPIDRGAEVRLDKPGVQMVDERFFPDRYSFTFKGAYFLVVSTGGPQGVEESVIQWMRDELSKAGIYDARYVVSYLPLHKFGDAHLGSLDKRFRLYELFLRARVTTLFSAGYRVYFNGRYGALPVVSVGALAGPGGKLSGSDFAQPNSFVVVDQVGGVKQRVLAVEGPTFDAVFDEGLLPESVEVYTR